MNNEKLFIEQIATNCDERNSDETCSRYEGSEHEPTDCRLENCPKLDEIRAAGIRVEIGEEGIQFPDNSDQ